MNLKYFNVKQKISKLELFFNDFNDFDSKYPELLSKENIVAYWKFLEFSDRINQGNNSLLNVSAVSDTLAYYNLCDAILSYQACYDYFYQIIFFAFGFNNDFSTNKEYLNLIKTDCRLNINYFIEKKKTKLSNFSKRVEEHLINTDFKNFFNQFLEYITKRNDNEIGIDNWANCIKHQGGFIIQEVYTKFRTENFYFNSSNNQADSFNTSVIYAYKPTKKEVIDRLFKQNENIIKIANWLFDKIFSSDQISKYQTHPLPSGNRFFSI